VKPVIALVGRPNVGKSTLFNALTQSRDALVADLPGLTRDRKYGHASFSNKTFIVVDTGGLSGESAQLDQHMATQTMYAIEESNVVLFLVDARDGLTAADENIAARIRRSGKTIHLVLNKTDGVDATLIASEFYTLGLGEPIAIAAAHNRGIRSLLERVLAPFDQSAPVIDSAHGIKVAFVGRPNVGKSTMVNRILGEERVVVFDMPGTTRDSIYIPFERDHQRYTLIDTAGVRRRKSVHDAVEKYSVIKTMQAIEEANVVVMMMDAQKEIADQDLHLLSFTLEAGRALVVVVNKWDGLDSYQKDRIRAEVDAQLSFVRFAEIFYVSALHGSNVGKLYAAIDRAYASATSDLATSELTRMLEQAVTAHQPPLISGRRVKLRYAHQGGVNPPRIIIHGNQTDKVPASYQKYLTNFFSDAIHAVGTPIVIEFKGGVNPYENRKNKLSKRQQFKRARMIQHIKQRERKRKKR
jgi:GTP-binding protein